MTGLAIRLRRDVNGQCGAGKGLIKGAIDAVIAQDAGHEVRSAIRVLMAKADNTPLIAGQERIRIEIFVRDNLP